MDATIMQGIAEAGRERLEGEVRVGQGAAQPTELAQVGAVSFVVRYLDALSLESARTAYLSVPRNRQTPLGFVVYREAGKDAFKMSCPHCNQKLWIKDANIGRRGRCPNCKKAFDIPQPAELLRNYLGLAADVPLAVVTGTDFAPAVDQLCGLAVNCKDATESQNLNSLNATTMIELEFPEE